VLRELVAKVGTHVALLLARIAQLAVSAAAAEVLVRELCLMSAAVKGNTLKRPLTSTSVAEAISKLSVPREISHASLRVAVF